MPADRTHPPLSELPDRWVALCRSAGARDDYAGAGARVLNAYGHPSRAYHDLTHLAEVLDHVDELATDLGPPGTKAGSAVRFAAWFHDAVYDPTDPAGNEEASARLAESVLTRLRVDPGAIAEVARLVRLTAQHDPAPEDVAGAVLCDADLAVLARPDEGYARYVAAVRREYAHVSDADFRAGRARVLRGLLAQPVLFRTELGHARWESAARSNVETELARLSAGQA
jgi:predicted metal-dependent HD superfamily phosphohydrolase